MDIYAADRTCSKCGFDRIEDRAIRERYHFDAGRFHVRIVIARTCLRCKFNWDELPLDALDAQPVK